jgi:hypothetical protein
VAEVIVAIDESSVHAPIRVNVADRELVDDSEQQLFRHCRTSHKSEPANPGKCEPIFVLSFS